MPVLQLCRIVQKVVPKARRRDAVVGLGHISRPQIAQLDHALKRCATPPGFTRPPNAGRHRRPRRSPGILVADRLDYAFADLEPKLGRPRLKDAM